MSPTFNTRLFYCGCAEIVLHGQVSSNLLFQTCLCLFIGQLRIGPERHDLLRLGVHACTNRLAIEYLPKPPVFAEAAPLSHPRIEAKGPFRECHNILFEAQTESRVGSH